MIIYILLLIIKVQVTDESEYLVVIEKLIKQNVPASILVEIFSIPDIAIWPVVQQFYWIIYSGDHK